jgi:hypothetical protein
MARKRSLQTDMKAATQKATAAQLLGYEYRHDVPDPFFKMSESLREYVSSAWKEKVRLQGEIKEIGKQATFEHVQDMLNCLLPISFELVGWAVPGALEGKSFPSDPKDLSILQKRYVAALLIKQLFPLLGGSWTGFADELAEAIEAVRFGELAPLLTDDQITVRGGAAKRGGKSIRRYTEAKLRLQAVRHVAFRVAGGGTQKDAIAIVAAAYGFDLSARTVKGWYCDGAALHSLDGLSATPLDDAKAAGKAAYARQAQLLKNLAGDRLRGAGGELARQESARIENAYGDAGLNADGAAFRVCRT